MISLQSSIEQLPAVARESVVTRPTSHSAKRRGEAAESHSRLRTSTATFAVGARLMSRVGAFG